LRRELVTPADGTSMFVLVAVEFRFHFIACSGGVLGQEPTFG